MTSSLSTYRKRMNFPVRRKPVLSGIRQIRAEHPSRFIKTTEYIRFAEFCKNCAEERYIGICSGPPGVGKTLSARFYSDFYQIQQFYSSLSHDETPKFLRHCRTIYYVPTVTNNPYQIEWDLTDLYRRQSLTIQSAHSEQEQKKVFDAELIDLIIIDEADRLRFSSLDMVRDLFDALNIGIVLIGMPGLARKLSRFPQFYSRVGFLHEYRSLTPSAIRELAKTQSESLLKLPPGVGIDKEALKLVASITNGNMRLLNKLASQINRIMRLNKLKQVNSEVVETAKLSLLIGSKH